MIVYVVTPSLNKSFKFQSDWPKNNSQIYLLESLLNDIKNDENRKFSEKTKGYEFKVKANYPNNNQFVMQKITVDKNCNFKSVEVLNSSDIPQMVMIFNNIDWNSDFNDNYFDLDSIIEEIDEEKIETNDKNDKKDDSTKGENKDVSKDDNKNGTQDDNGKNESNSTGSIDDIIFPLYIPTGTSLTEQEKISKANGERVILTFDGEKPFLLVEETSSVDDEFNIIPTFGEPYMLADTVGALTNNSITWSSNGIDYYIVSDAMSQVELIEIASSISAIPTFK